MVPPKDFNLCPVCGGELPFGAEFCLKCGEKLVPDERPVIDHTPTNPPEHSREDITNLVTEEPSVVQEPESAPVLEEPSVEDRLTELPADQYLKSIYGLPVIEEPSFVDQFRSEPLEVPFSEIIPPAFVENEPRAEEEVAPVVSEVPHLKEPEVPPVSERIVPRFVEEETVIEIEPARTTFEVDEEAGLPIYESSYAEPVIPEPTPIPMPRIVPPQSIEEEIPPEFKQPPIYSGPVTDDIMRTVNGECGHVTPEPMVAGAPSEFGFCIACGQRLPPDALYCPRCGKNTAIPEFTKVPLDTLKVEFPVIRPGNIPLPPVVNMPVAEQEPAPVPPPHVEPKYRPVSSREPISNAMADFAPSMPHHPNARASGGATLQKVWLNVKGWTVNALNEAWDFTKGQQKGFRELFNKLFEEREITPVNMSSAEALKHTTKAVEAPVKRPIPRIYIILGVIAYIVLFVAIGLTISRCSSG
jgi:ribosomal protein L40E